MRFVLDTGVFYRPEALRRIAETEVDVVVPAIVYMERVRQLQRDGRDARALDQALAANHFTIEPFGKDEGLRYAARMHDDALWRRVFRDAMIAGHVHERDILWTTDPKDFLLVGLEAHQVHAV